MVSIDELVYAPVNLTKGANMDANEYAVKVKELENIQKAIEIAIAPLTDAAQRLEGNGWQDLPVEGHKPRPIQTGDRAGQPRRLSLKEWPTLTEIKDLAAKYWSALRAVEEAWDALPAELKEVMRPPGRRKWD